MVPFFKITSLCAIMLMGGLFSSNSSFESEGSLDSRFRESGNTTHKYYVSVSNVKYSKKAGAVQMLTRFFIDDLQKVLNARNEKQVELGDASEIKEHLEGIQYYLNLKLKTEINGAEVTPKLLGAEYEGDQILLYIEFSKSKIPATVSMEFNAFYELFEEQKNLVHFKIKGERKTMILERGQPSDHVKF
ncbi:MAG: DUF6702 family protein [Nonlabens sp.]